MSLLTLACSKGTGGSWGLAADRLDRAVLERQVRLGATEVKIIIGQSSMVCSSEDLRCALAAAGGSSLWAITMRKVAVGVVLFALGAGIGAASMMPPSGQAGRHQKGVAQEAPTARATEAYWRRVNDICSAAMDRGTQIAANVQQSSVNDPPQVQKIKALVAMASIRPEVQKAALAVEGLGTNGVAPVIVEAARARAAFNVTMVDSMAKMGNQFAANPNMNDTQGAAVMMQWMGDITIANNAFKDARSTAFRETKESLGLDLSPITEKNGE